MLIELLLEVLVLLLLEVDGDDLGEFEQKGLVRLVEGALDLLLLIPPDPEEDKDGEGVSIRSCWA